MSEPFQQTEVATFLSWSLGSRRGILPILGGVQPMEEEDDEQ